MFFATKVPMRARIPGCSEFEGYQNNERGICLACRGLASREAWFASGAVGLGYAAGKAPRQPPRSGASRMKLAMRTISKAPRS